MKTLSLVIPTFNEESLISDTVTTFHEVLNKAHINHNFLVVNDYSTDGTEQVLKELASKISIFKYFNNSKDKGFGFAVREGLEHVTGDYVALVMADMSDSPEDLIKYYKAMEEGFDCVFGSRFMDGGKVIGYPRLKLIFNRIVNNFIRLMFGIRYNDITNAFKIYSRDTVDNLKPFLSNHFNITVELPLKAVVRGHTYAIIPNSWTNRKVGKSNLKMREMGSRYFFIILYCLLEKWLSKGDYKKRQT